MTVSAKPIKRVAIIGGGASGAIALDSLIKEAAFDVIHLYERRDVLGGIWVLDPKPDALNINLGSFQQEFDPPRTPKVPLAPGDVLEEQNVKYNEYVHTPSYEGMRSNIPELIMTYSDKTSWPGKDFPGQDAYTSAGYVRQYIDEYLRQHASHLILGTTVESTTKQDDQWILTLKQTTRAHPDGSRDVRWFTETYDAVVVATGHYHVPYVPEVKGLPEVLAARPEAIEHAKTYRDPARYANQTVVLVGSRASGVDLAVHIALHAKRTILSRRHESSVVISMPGLEAVELRPAISEYLLQPDGSFDLIFADGERVNGVDKVIYGTGYHFSYPFLSKQIPDFTDGVILPHLFQHTFYIEDPTLALVGVPIDGLSFRVFEYQAVLVSRFLAGKVKLPSIEKQREWTRERFAKFGSTRAYHSIGIKNAVQYLNELTQLGGGADPIGGTGRPFPVVGAKEAKALEDAWGKLGKLWDENPVVLENSGPNIAWEDGIRT